MEAVVGGRLETVAPRPLTDAGERWRLVGLVALAVAVHGWLVANTYVTARDSIRFARTALVLSDPARGAGPDDRRTVADVVKEAEDPPGFPVAVLAASYAVRAAYDPGGPNPLAHQMLLATQVASAVAGVLLLFPTYWLARQLFGKFAGFVAAVSFQVLPVPAHVTSDGLSDGLCLLMLGTALGFGTRAVRKPSVGRFLQCGLATGLAYLVRPEGVLGGVAVGAVVGGMGLLGARPRGASVGWLTALAVGAAVPATPYMLLIGGISNKPTVQGVQDQIINVRSRLTSSLAPTPPGAALFADVFIPVVDEPKWEWLVRAVTKESLKSFHYGTAVFALVGLAAARGRFRREPQFWVPTAFAAMSLGVVVLVGYRREYISERHTLPLVFVGCVFAGGGVEALGRWLAAIPWAVVGPRGSAGLILLAVVGSALPATLKPLHPQRVGHVLAGLYLAEHAKPEDVIVDPFEWAQYYSGRTLTSIPPDPARPPRSWVVLVAKTGDPKRDAHPDTRLPRLELAESIAFHPASRVVYQWPEGEVLKGRVFVYLREEKDVAK